MNFKTRNNPKFEHQLLSEYFILSIKFEIYAYSAKVEVKRKYYVKTEANKENQPEEEWVQNINSLVENLREVKIPRERESSLIHSTILDVPPKGYGVHNYNIFESVRSSKSPPFATDPNTWPFMWYLWISKLRYLSI